MTKYLQLEQGSLEWHRARLGRVGGSECAPLAVAGKRHGLGDGAWTLLYKKAEEIISGEMPDSYENDDTRRGNELEPEAKWAYTLQTGLTVEDSGYYQSGDYFGVSLDGIDEEGTLLEVKCPRLSGWLRTFDTKEVPNDHMTQMQWGMMIADLPRAKYLVYHEQAGLIIIDVPRDEELIAKLKLGSIHYEARLKNLLSQYEHFRVLPSA